MRMDHSEASSSPILRLISAIRTKRQRRQSDSRSTQRARRPSSTLNKEGRWRSELALVERPNEESSSNGGTPDVFLVPMFHASPSPSTRKRRLTVGGGATPSRNGEAESQSVPASSSTRRYSLSDLEDMRSLAARGCLGRPFERGIPIRRSRETANLTSCNRSCYDERVLVVGSQRGDRIRFPSRCGPVVA